MLSGEPVTPGGAPAVIDPAAYVALKWLETGTFLVLAGGLSSVCYWRMRRLT